ncbi:MAG TPA: hypothetical protein IAA15_04815 [Candidatus Olsenella pullicola]|nr:hypothetical protein [Candidatus Olsenella pullicola]
MEDYNLAPGELVVMQEQSVKLGNGAGDEDLDELVLTNQNLILVASASHGLFKKTRMLKRCPLEKIRWQNDAPQVFATKYRSSYCLQAAFEDETVTLCFPANPRRLAERWARAIAQAADGELSGIGAEDDLPPEITNIVDGAKDLVGSLFGGGRQPRGAAQKERPANVTKKCVGCHAPITGRAGSPVTCSYCDTRQTL